MSRRFLSWVVAVVALVSTGCLQHQTTHTLYVSPDNTVAWVCEEREVHSDETDPAGRAAEEDRYLGEVLSATHTTALALAALKPVRPVRTHVLRVERPFHVVTEARFENLQDVLQRLFDDGGVKAEVWLQRDANETTLHVWFDPAGEGGEGNGAVLELLMEFDHYQFVLTDGEFTSAEGFDIHGSTATISKAWLEESETTAENPGQPELILTWH